MLDVIDARICHRTLSNYDRGMFFAWPALQSPPCLNGSALNAEQPRRLRVAYGFDIFGKGHAAQYTRFVDTRKTFVPRFVDSRFLGCPLWSRSI